jgi:pimeloyl-ACP methyl ester carboxylesterase
VSSAARPTERAGEFEFEGYRLAYGEWGSGERTLVLVHGLLMNRRMYDLLAPAVAARGYRVVTLDLLGHGRSERPPEMHLYNMPAFAKQLAALVDHLELERPVVGGTSLGANTALEFAVANPGRARALVVEMPVLDNALLGASLFFTPILVGLRFARPALRGVAAVTTRLPRSHFLVDLVLDWTRQDPEASTAVLEGILFGRTAPPPPERRRIAEPALVIGHPGEPLHPFSDAGNLAEEMPNARVVGARSIVEWRTRPARLNEILVEFLEEAYAAAPAAGRDAA